MAADLGPTLPPFSLREDPMRTLSDCRQRRSRQERHEIVARFERSGLSENRFCKGQRLTRKTFRTWRQPARGGRSRSTRQWMTDRLLPARSKAPPEIPTPSTGLASLLLHSERSSATSAGPTPGARRGTNGPPDAPWRRGRTESLKSPRGGGDCQRHRGGRGRKGVAPPVSEGPYRGRFRFRGRPTCRSMPCSAAICRHESPSH